jgi:hypothetical protein
MIVGDVADTLIMATIIIVVIIISANGMWGGHSFDPQGEGGSRCPKEDAQGE